LALSTACWRHYLGTWEIREGRLFLVQLRGLWKLEGAEPLFADWFTGVLKVPQGQMLQYAHFGFETVYEQDLFIEIENGVVVRSWVVDNRAGSGGGKSPQ